MIGCRDRGCWCSWYDWLSISTTNRMTNALRHERPATASQGVRVFQFLGFIPIGWKIKFSSSHWSEFFFDQWDVLNFIFQPMGVLCKNWAKAQFLQSELEPIHGSSSLISTFLLFNILSKHVIITITCFDITSGWGSEPHPESSMKLSGGGINPSAEDASLALGIRFRGRAFRRNTCSSHMNRYSNENMGLGTEFRAPYRKFLRMPPHPSELPL